MPEVEICVFQIKEFAHWTFRQGISSPHQQPHNRTAVDLTLWPPPFSTCKSCYNTTEFPILKPSPAYPNAAVQHVEHRDNYKANTGQSYLSQTPSAWGGIFLTIPQHPHAKEHRPQTSSCLLKAQNSAFPLHPCPCQTCPRGLTFFQYSNSCTLQTLKTESSSCHKMFFTRSSSAVSSAKGCIPYPSGQTAAWVTLSWELRLNRGAVLAGLQWWTCPQPHCERCFYLKGCNYSPTQLILTMRDLSHRAVKSVIRHPNQTLVDPHTDLPQQISTDHYQRAVSRLMFVITPGTVRGFKYVTTREKW